MTLGSNQLQNHIRPLENEKRLFVPNYSRNIARIMPTLLEFMGLSHPKRESLLQEKALKEVFTANNCFGCKFVINLIIDGLGMQGLNQGNLVKKLFKKNSGIFLSSVFPTLTVPGLASIHLGCTPETHGIVGNFFQTIDDGSRGHHLLQ